MNSDMKKLLITLVALLMCASLGTEGSVNAKPSEEHVYVVMSSTAHAYHKTKSCKGLRNATHPIKEVTLHKATVEMGRRPCHYCYGGK